MIKRTRTAVLVAFVLFASLILTACGPSADTPVASTAASSTTSAGGSASTTSAATTAAGGAATTAAMTSAAAGSGGTDIRIGLIGPFTGPSGSFGTAIKRGATMAVEDINNNGGINGRKIVFVERDDQATPNQGVTIVRDLIDKENVLALLGTANTAVGVVEAPIVQQSKIPWVIPVTTGTKITQEPGNPSYIFRDSMVDQYQTKFVAESALAKYKKIAIIHDDTSYGQLGETDLVARFKEKSFTGVVLDETYKAAGTPDDMKPIINKVKDAQPEVIINWGLGTAGGNIAKAMKDLGVTIPVIGSWGLSQPELHKVGGGAEEGTIVAQTFTNDTSNQKQQDFINRYKSEFKADIMDFPSGVAQAYDSMRMLGEALKQPGAADSRDKLRDALENLSGFDGVLKKYDKPFSNQYHEALTDKDFLFAVWKGGQLVKYNS